MSRPWDHEHPEPGRAAVLRSRLGALAPVQVNLLVSVAAGQALPLVGDVGPIVTWVVEAASDLHWLDAGIGLRRRTDAWLVGSRASADALAARDPELAAVPVAVEFVPPPQDVPAADVARVRQEVGAGSGDLVVAGVGIATRRKGIDLFVEAAAALAGEPSVRCVWVGGERDPLYGPARVAARRLPHLTVLPSTDDVDAVFAAADVVLHTAREDSFPLACLHAASRGRPVVAFAGVGGVSEMLGAAFVGAPYPDVAALVAVVVGLARDPKRRAATGAAQRGHVTERYLVPTAAPQLRDLVRRALAVTAR